MIKNAVKQHYGLVDATSKVELEAALASLNAPKAETVEQKHGAALLEDGETMIFFPGDVFVDGSGIFTDAEMTIPAEDGEWVLENGDIIVVSEGIGILQPAIADEEAPEGEAPEAPVDEEVLAEPGTPGSPSSVKETTTTTTETSFNAEAAEEPVEKAFGVEQVFEALQPIFDEFSARLAALEGTTTETETKNEELSKQVEKLSKAPAAKTYTEKSNYSAPVRESGYNGTRAKLGIK